MNSYKFAFTCIIWACKLTKIRAYIRHLLFIERFAFSGDEWWRLSLAGN